MRDSIAHLVDLYANVTDGSSALLRADLLSLCRQHAVPEHQFCNAFAQELAARYADGSMDVERAAFAADDMHQAAGFVLPEFARRVFDLLEYGEASCAEVRNLLTEHGRAQPSEGALERFEAMIQVIIYLAGVFALGLFHSQLKSATGGYRIRAGGDRVSRAVAPDRVRHRQDHRFPQGGQAPVTTDLSADWAAWSTALWKRVRVARWILLVPAMLASWCLVLLG